MKNWNAKSEPNYITCPVNRLTPPTGVVVKEPEKTKAIPVLPPKEREKQMIAFLKTYKYRPWRTLQFLCIAELQGLSHGDSWIATGTNNEKRTQGYKNEMIGKTVCYIYYPEGGAWIKKGEENE